ncbi:MAG: rhodanese-like domain-containing protein [Novosphingobium sp.]|nr:rhodanese-like domain-containing protein [Novosphingobium sp.]
MAHLRSLALAALLISPCPALAQSVHANPLIDYGGFEKLVREVGPLREARRIEWARFAKEEKENNAILLDARSAADFARGHIAGAVNLPFSEFTDAKLKAVLGPDRQRPIYIYCNNNFSDNVAPVVSKRVELALNIPTFVNLVGYGYANVWELADVVSIADPRIGWVSSES